jgi:hypothetical protein
MSGLTESTTSQKAYRVPITPNIGPTPSTWYARMDVWLRGVLVRETENQIRSNGAVRETNPRTARAATGEH